MKNNIIEAIVSGLNGLGIAFSRNEGSDLLIQAGFLDASWGVGNKRINYQARILADEATQTVYMWEFTKEEGAGLSFGASGETFTQTGKTLYRKVKSVQYGPEGKAYEINMDLGAIPKLVKEAAKSQGWKFKTVLKKEKAMFGASGASAAGTTTAGASASAAGAGAAATATAIPHEAPQRAPVGKKPIGTFSWLVFFFVLFVVAALFFLSETSVTGWALAGAAFLLILILQSRLAAKGCLPRILLWISAVVVLFLVYAFTTDTEQGGKAGKAESKPAVSNSSEKASGSSGQASQAKSPFTINQYMMTVLAGDHVDYKAKTSMPYAYAYFVLSVNKDSGNDKSYAVKSMKITNFKVEKQEAGKVAFYKVMGRDNAFDPTKRKGFEMGAELEAREVELSELMNVIGDSAFVKSENNGGYTGRLEFICFQEHKSSAIKEDYNALNTQQLAAIIKPAVVSFDLVIENETGETFVKHFRQELFTTGQIENTEVINSYQNEVIEGGAK